MLRNKQLTNPWKKRDNIRFEDASVAIGAECPLLTPKQTFVACELGLLAVRVEGAIRRMRGETRRET